MIADWIVVFVPVPSADTVNIGVKVDTSPMPFVTESQLSLVGTSMVVTVVPPLTKVEATEPPLAMNFAIV